MQFLSISSRDQVFFFASPKSRIHGGYHTDPWSIYQNKGQNDFSKVSKKTRIWHPAKVEHSKSVFFRLWKTSHWKIERQNLGKKVIFEISHKYWVFLWHAHLSLFKMIGNTNNQFFFEVFKIKRALRFHGFLWRLRKNIPTCLQLHFFVKKNPLSICHTIYLILRCRSKRHQFPSFHFSYQANITEKTQFRKIRDLKLLLYTRESVRKKYLVLKLPLPNMNSWSLSLV